MESLKWNLWGDNVNFAWCHPSEPSIEVASEWVVPWSSWDGLASQWTNAVCISLYTPEPYPTPADYEPEVAYHPDSPPYCCAHTARWTRTDDMGEVWA